MFVKVKSVNGFPNHCGVNEMSTLECAYLPRFHVFAVIVSPNLSQLHPTSPNTPQPYKPQPSSRVLAVIELLPLPYITITIFICISIYIVRLGTGYSKGKPKTITILSF